MLRLLASRARMASSSAGSGAPASPPVDAAFVAHLAKLAILEPDTSAAHVHETAALLAFVRVLEQAPSEQATPSTASPQTEAPPPPECPSASG